MKKFNVTLIICFSMLYFSCYSSKEPSEKAVLPPTQEKKEELIVESPVPQKVQVEEKKEVEQAPTKVVENENSAIKEEYSRSIGNVEVSIDTFLEDKAKILETIKELESIMKSKNYMKWMNYIDSNSLNYWKNPENLRKAQSKLPVKGLKLKDLEDYFKYIFIPARQNRTVTEIRYISDNYVKAIEVKSDFDYVYYYFNKINGKWLIHLPPLE